MSTGFDPSKLGNKGGGTSQPSNKGPRPERVFLVVKNFDLPSDAPHFAVGHKLNEPGTEIRVRLNTVKERIADFPGASEDKIKSQYVSGDNHRDSIEDKSKAGIKLIAFDDAKLIADVDGVKTYRAHWPKTISTSPDAEMMHGMAHIRLREAGEAYGKYTQNQAYVELLKGAEVANPENIDQLLTNALSISDDQGRARDPFAILRIVHNDAVVAQSRIYPATEGKQIFDQALGENKTINVPVNAGTTIDKLLSGVAGKNDIDNRSLDTSRAVISGLKGLPEPVLNSPDAGVRDSIRNLYFGAQGGNLKLEVISAEKIDFGADSRKTYVKDKDRPQLAAYTIKEPAANDKVKETPGFANTVIAVLRHENGEPYAIFASPADMFPKAKKQGDLSLDVINQLALSAEVQAEAQAEMEAPADNSHLPNDEENGYESGPGM